MHKLTNISTTMTLIALSTTLFMSASMAQTASNSTTSNNNAPINHTTAASSATANTSSSTTATTPAADVSTFTSAADASNASVDASTGANAPTDVSPVTSGVSQKLIGNSKTATSLNKLLPTIEYTTDNLPTFAQKVNSANWKPDTNVSRSMSTKLQALLNWHQNSVGPVDGYWGKNSIKAMQAFQKSRGLKITNNLNEETWQALAQNEKLMSQPVLVSYKLSDADVNIKTVTIPPDTEAKSKLEGMYYESVIEGLAEKFHMSEKYLQALNPNATFRAGETITVYNPANPNTKQVSRVVADQATETLYAYDEQNNMVASYPTTVGSTATPSPTGTHKVKVKVHEPNYTYTGKDGNKLIIPPGPNNPVGVVWIGLSKPSYGIHGSPDPARISRQASSGCVRLTNWDALALLGTIKDDATVEFK